MTFYYKVEISRNRNRVIPEVERGKTYAEVSEENKKFTRLKLIMSHCTNNKFIISNLPLLKYFIMINLKVIYEVGQKGCV
jgi:hypothetical protein